MNENWNQDENGGKELWQETPYVSRYTPDSTLLTSSFVWYALWERSARTRL